MDREQQRFHAAVAAMQGLFGSGRVYPEDPEAALHARIELCLKYADALLAELDRTKPEPVTPQPDGFPDFPKWQAYEGLGTIKEGDEDIFLHRNLSSLTERHNRAIAAFRDWATKQASEPKPDADGWIPHDGKGMPCDPNLLVHIKSNAGTESCTPWPASRRAEDFNSWVWGSDSLVQIIAWKPA